jgi:hypothetical protein
MGFLGNIGDDDSYHVQRSLRFNSADSAYLSRTFSGPVGQSFLTFSAWIKLGVLGTARQIFSASTNHFFGLTTGNALNLTFAGISRLTTSSLLRDPGAWYHIVWVQDQTSHTIYINGVSAGTATATSSVFNTAVAHQIGAVNATNLFNGYMAEIYFIDGQALNPAFFAETDAITQRWKAKAYSGSYGNNGFYLNFSDNSAVTAAALGADSSGNGRNWTPSGSPGFSVTAGVGDDSLVESPTNYKQTISNGGGEYRGNYCTWNPLFPGDSCINGNLDVVNDTARGNQELMQYDAYWEVTSTGGTCLAGIIGQSSSNTVTVGSSKTFGFKLSESGIFQYANITDGAQFTTTGTVSSPQFCYASTGAAITASLNCGQRSFLGAMPTGFNPICVTSLDKPIIQNPGKHVTTIPYQGNQLSLNQVVGSNFKPDLVWIAQTDNGSRIYDLIIDSTRGTTRNFSVNQTFGVSEGSSNSKLISFNDNGFSLGNSTDVNQSTTGYQSWLWKQSTLSCFDVVSYTGNGSNRTVSHNLESVPKFILIKSRSDTTQWTIYHSEIGPTGYLNFDDWGEYYTSSSAWNNSSPTSSVFSLGSSTVSNKSSQTYMAYLFSEKYGFNKFGSYTGTGLADGPFVSCGFRPQILIVKAATSGVLQIDRNWVIIDKSRIGYNGGNYGINPNYPYNQDTSNYFDILSNGFKTKSTAINVNSSGEKYSYAAFAEFPLKYSRSR